MSPSTERVCGVGARTMGVLALLTCTLVACTPAPAGPEPAEPSPRELPASDPPGAPSPVPPSAVSPHIRFEHASEGELTALAREFVARARAEGRTPLVYVGATWCEPCQYFHAAAERGDLDAELPPLSLLELDLDHDRERIAAAGYGSRMIPLFAVPGDDGRGTGRQIEGSIHGPGSPSEIAPRLRALLSPP